MRLRLLAIAAGCLALAGCANYVWTRPDLTQEALDRDAFECDVQARELARDFWLYAPPRFGGFWRGRFGDPFWDPPYPDLAAEMDIRDRVFSRCMVLKGYRLQKVPEDS
jgi:hypothetical protein